MNSKPDKVLNLGSMLRKVFSLGDRILDKNDSPDTIPSWDSFQSLIMFQELEQVTGASFDIKDLKNIKSIKDIVVMLDKYGISNQL